MTVLQVTEIVRRLDQGMTRPFLVRAEDDALYVAKGWDTSRRGLIAEWLCAHLAQRVRLTMPEFCLLDVPEELTQALGPEGKALGHGLVFGSRQQAGVQEFAVTQLGQVDAGLRQRLLAFDWWVENADRSLSPHGGNPNLLWRASEQRLFVIDHNLAFESGFEEALFFETHVFRDDAQAVFEDWVRKDEISGILTVALECYDEAALSVPDAWWWLDGETRTLPLQVDLKVVKSRLAARAGLERGFK